MPLIAAKLKSKMKDTIEKNLKQQFASGSKDNKEAEKQWTKMAEAISAIAEDIVAAIQQDAEVAPGIPTAGSPAAQVTTGPGKIL